MKKRKNAEVWISAILYILIITAAIVLVLKVGVPILEKMKDRQSFSNSKETMLAIDKTIQEVANEGEGSQRILPVDIKDGKITIRDDEIVWETKTKTEVLDKSTSLNYGNMIVSSNANVKTWDYGSYYVMQTEIEGDIFNVTIKKFGSTSNITNISTEDLIQEISYNGEKLSGGFSFSINGDPGTINGTGYTEMIPPGNNTNIGNAKVVAHIQSTGFDYDLEIGLESFADFITVELKNVKVN